MTRPAVATLMMSLLLTLGAVGCAGKKPTVPAADLWSEANSLFDDEAYDYAIQKYKQMLDQYPFDPNAEEASLKIAQAHYNAKKYQEAIAAYGDFQRMHPTSENLPKPSR